VPNFLPEASPGVWKIPEGRLYEIAIGPSPVWELRGTHRFLFQLVRLGPHRNAGIQLHHNGVMPPGWAFKMDPTAPLVVTRPAPVEARVYCFADGEEAMGVDLRVELAVRMRPL
jgi:hypothetical protein